MTYIARRAIKDLKNAWQYMKGIQEKIEVLTLIKSLKLELIIRKAANDPNCMEIVETDMAEEGTTVYTLNAV